MSMDVYPASPVEVPADFTSSSPRYRLRVAIVLLSLLLFLSVYAALMATSVWLVLFWLGTMTGVGGEINLITLGGMTAAGFFFVFLLKGLFKRQRQDRSEMIELRRDAEPVLFEFLDRLISDTGAPTPKRVYVSPEVNASVFYDISVLGLFLPVRKNLLIGLGLVNELNLSELKAVLAHELGHFSQRSMKVGSYVYIANKVIGDMVFARDSWDRALAGWARIDLRVAWPAWILMALVWGVRQVLGLLFRIINILDAALSREMEFNADRVAVSATGSDAIVNALKRLVFADACMNQTFHDLSTASDHKLYTRDVFYHQERSAEHLRKVAGDDSLGTPPPVPAVDPGNARVFAADDDSKPSMWSTHPRDRDREDNAKAIYVPAVLDERPAWVLFSNPQALREAASEKLVRRVLGTEISLSAPADVQVFIDEERAETTFDPRYHEIYEGRTLNPGSLVQAFDAEPRVDAEIAAEYEQLWGAAVASKMVGYKKLDGELKLLVGVLSGERVGRSFSFRGDDRPKGDAELLAEQVISERSEIFESMSEVDKRVLWVHAEMANQLKGDWGDELRQRYQCHLSLQELSDELRQGTGALQGSVDLLTSGEDLDSSAASTITDGFEQARDAIRELWSKARDVELPAMSNVEAGTTLAEFAFDGPQMDGPFLLGDEFQVQTIEALISHYDTANGRIQRTFFKSMGGLLALQEAIAARWSAR